MQTLIQKTSIEGLLYLDYDLHGDERGFFAEIALLPDLNQMLPQPFVPVQFNLAVSQQYVARGLHAENWNKLITVISGTAQCVIADIRADSPTYQQTESFVLGDSGQRGCIYIPSGLANGYCVTQGPANYFYMVDALYRDRNTSGDQAISLFDPDLAIPWSIPQDQMILSDRDKSAVYLKNLQ
jgi:dTDP-4-dehydrorhamnose 3,5-epimerase